MKHCQEFRYIPPNFCIALLFFILAIIQASFFPYFAIMGAVPNVVFALFFILIFFEEKQEYSVGFFTAILAGFFMDVFLPFYFGVSMIILLSIYFLQKLVVGFLKEGQDKYPILYFIPTFSACFILYYAAWYLVSLFSSIKLNFGFITLVSLAYTLVFACIGFYLYKKFFYKKDEGKQLKLL